MSNVSISELLPEMWPYIIALLAVLGIVTFVPGILDLATASVRLGTMTMLRALTELDRGIGVLDPLVCRSR